MTAKPAYGPENLDVLSRAFSAAWKEVRSKHLTNREAARARLASIILDAAQDRDLDVEQLRDIAIESVSAVPLETLDRGLVPR
jgi:hypothetical protein